MFENAFFYLFNIIAKSPCIREKDLQTEKSPLLLAQKLYAFHFWDLLFKLCRIFYRFEIYDLRIKEILWPFFF